MKTLALVVLAVLSLGGCIAVPYDSGYYGGPAYYGPSVGVGIDIYGGRHYRGHRRSHW